MIQNTMSSGVILGEQRYGKTIEEIGALDTLTTLGGHLIWCMKVKVKDGQKMQRRTMYLESDSKMKLDDIEKVHPMKQIAVASVVQIIMLAFMGFSMYLIGVAFG